MSLSRRGLLGMFAAGTAAAIVRTPGLLMPVKPVRIVTVDYSSYLAWERVGYKIANPPVLELGGLITFPLKPSEGDVVTVNGMTYHVVRRPMRVTYSRPASSFSLAPGSVNRI